MSNYDDLMAQRSADWMARAIGNAEAANPVVDIATLTPEEWGEMREQIMPGLGQLYRQHAAQTSGAAQHQEDYYQALERARNPQPMRADIYVQAPDSSLEAYTQRSKEHNAIDPLARRADESAEAHSRRVAPLIRHAPDAVSDEVWAEHRAVMAARTTGEIHGDQTARDRAAAVAANRAPLPGRDASLLGSDSTAIGQARTSRVYASQIAEHQPWEGQRSDALLANVRPSDGFITSRGQ